MKFCFIDTETSGTDKEKSAMLQLAGKIVIDGKVVETFDIKSAPFEGDIIEPKALEVNGLTEMLIRANQSPGPAYRQFLGILGKHCDKYDRTDKFQFVGFNADFDADMIRSWFAKNNDVYFGSWFWWPVLDVAKLAALRLMEQRHTMANFKLLTVAHALGLDVEEAKAHDASYDIDLTMRVFDTCIQGLTVTKLEI